MDTSRRIGEAYADGGADLVELGVPFSDPLADGPVIHAAGTAALRAGATVHDVLAVGRAPGRARAGGGDGLREPRAGARPGALRRRPRRRTALSGLIVPDLPLEESAAVREACDAAGVALVPLSRRRRPTSAWRASAPAPAASSTPCRSPARPASAPPWPTPSRTIVARAKARPTCRSRSASASRRPSRPREAADAGRRRRHRRQPPGARGGRGRRRRPPRSTTSWRSSPRRSALESAPHMGLVLATTVGLVIWIVLWALGVKAIDAFLITVLLIAPGRHRAHHRALPAGQSRRLTASGWTKVHCVTSPRSARVAGSY